MRPLIVKSDWEKKAHEAEKEDKTIGKQLKAVLNIYFTQWKSLPNPKSTVGSKVSRKIETHLPIPSFIDVLVKELTVMRAHLRRCYIQFSPYKHAREEAVRCSTVATIQMDWAENPKLRQTQEEHSRRPSCSACSPCVD